MAKNSSFDLDFGYGRKGELLVEELLTGGKTVEVLNTDEIGRAHV